jgi:ATP-binding protein involved in chromosome partitioning
MLRSQVKPTIVNRRVVPAVAHGVKVMSLGLFILDDSPLIWRGPMVANAVRQMLQDVEWGELDYLIVDLPPGTGDAALTLAQTIPLTGVVIVTTPQDAAVGIATKALQMFRRLGIDIIGVVENMSQYVCPHCGKRDDVFGRGGREAGGEGARRMVPGRNTPQLQDQAAERRWNTHSAHPRPRGRSLPGARQGRGGAGQRPRLSEEPP